MKHIKTKPKQAIFWAYQPVNLVITGTSYTTMSIQILKIKIRNIMQKFILYLKQNNNKWTSKDHG